jgi:hypothetical protein
MDPLKIGTEIEKTGSKPGDGHQDGARGKVVGVLGPVDVPGVDDHYGYFILWDDFPIPVFTSGSRVQPCVVQPSVVTSH